MEGDGAGLALLACEQIGRKIVYRGRRAIGSWKNEKSIRGITGLGSVKQWSEIFRIRPSATNDAIAELPKQLNQIKIAWLANAFGRARLDVNDQNGKPLIAICLLAADRVSAFRVSSHIVNALEAPMTALKILSIRSSLFSAV